MVDMGNDGKITNVLHQRSGNQDGIKEDGDQSGGNINN
jgi:hypothetical protein